MSSQNRFCDRCGKAVPNLDSKFCSSCGSQLSVAKDEPTEEPTPSASQESSAPQETVVGSDRKGSPFPRIILAVASFLFFPIGLIAGPWYMLSDNRLSIIISKTKRKERGFGGLLLGLGIISLLILLAPTSDNASDSDGSTPNETAASTKIVPTATLTPIPAVYSGCSGLEDLIPKLALPGSVTLSYWQVVNLGIDDTCDSIIKELNKPENLK